MTLTLNDGFWVGSSHPDSLYQRSIKYFAKTRVRKGVHGIQVPYLSYEHNLRGKEQ